MLSMSSLNSTLLSAMTIYIGSVHIPDVTKVTLSSVRLWQTITSVLVISYIALLKLLCISSQYTMLYQHSDCTVVYVQLNFKCTAIGSQACMHIWYTVLHMHEVKTFVSL